MVKPECVFPLVGVDLDIGVGLELEERRGLFSLRMRRVLGRVPPRRKEELIAVASAMAMAEQVRSVSDQCMHVNGRAFWNCLFCEQNICVN